MIIMTLPFALICLEDRQLMVKIASTFKCKSPSNTGFCETSYA